MKILDRFSFLTRKQAQPTLSGRLAIVHWDRDNLFYLVSSGASRTLKEGEHGVVSLIPTGAASDLTGGGIEESKRHLPLVALANHFQEQRISATRVVVLLSRPELDLLTLSLPPASVDELPTLVASEVLLLASRCLRSQSIRGIWIVYRVNATSRGLSLRRSVHDNCPL